MDRIRNILTIFILILIDLIWVRRTGRSELIFGYVKSDVISFGLFFFIEESVS